MAITIKDVAMLAGVSPITASRALSGTHPVSALTRQKVLQAAAELRYSPDLLARAMVRKQVPLIGIIVPALANPFFVTLVDAAQAVARQYEHMVLISQSERRLALEQTSLAEFRQMRCAGVLITPSTEQLAHLGSLRDEGSAVIALARRWEDGDYVTVDDFAGGEIAGSHLTTLGYKRIGVIAVDDPGHTGLQERLSGFKAALQASGLPFVADWMLQTDQANSEAGRQLAERFCALPERPEAIFATSDNLAIGFVHGLLERGVRVPQDVAVVGYDNIVYAEFLRVPLTTVALPTYEIGRQAAKILFERLLNGVAVEPWRQVRLTPQLTIRASCGAHSS